MKIFATVLAYIGLAFVMLGAASQLDFTIQILAAPESAWAPGGVFYHGWPLGMVFGTVFAWAIAGLGALLALIGGAIARPRYLWIALVVIGIIYVLSMEMYLSFSKGPRGAVFQIDVDIIRTPIFLLPGIACIIGGLVLRKPKRRRVESL